MAETQTTPTYGGIWTKKGIEKLANFAAIGTPINIVYVAIGDANGTTPKPNPSQTALINENWRGNVSSVQPKTVENSSSVIVEVIIPYDIGGFFIREWGLFDEVGDLIVYGNHAEFYKALLAEGTGAELRELFELPISSDGQITITVSYESLASVDFVNESIDKALDEHDGDDNAHASLLGGFSESLGVHNKDVDAHAPAFNKHNIDINAHGNLLTIINHLEFYRYSRIGHVEAGHTMNDAHYIPADGRIVDLANYTELLKKIQDGHIHSRSSYSSSYPGVWSLHRGTQYHSPNMEGQFIRFSTVNTGLKVLDTMQKITASTLLGDISPDTFQIPIESAAGAFFSSHSEVVGMPVSGQVKTQPIVLNFDSSRVVRTASENQPKHIYQYPVIYLGRLSTEIPT